MVERIGIVGGSSFLEGAALEGAEVRRIETPLGEAHVHVRPDCAMLLRHGHGVYRPPHRIPHHANVLAFRELGVRRVVGLTSVGSLAPDLLPGTAVIPADYYSAHPPPTFAGDERLHIVPELDAELRALLAAAAGDTEGPIMDRGVYVETRGPRFETKAEIRQLSLCGNVVGMTAASEATLFAERDIRYAILGLVDNFANGIGNRTLTFEEYERMRVANQARAHAIVAAILARHRKENAA